MLISPPTFPLLGTSPAWAPAPSVCHPGLRAVTEGGRCPVCEPAAPLDRAVTIDEACDPAAELAALEAAALRELAELDRDAALASLSEFVRQGWHVLEGFELEWNWHHEALCQNVQGMLEEWLRIRAERQEQARTKRYRKWSMRWHKLVINICPASLKSRIIMVFAVAWMWLRCPSWSVMCMSVTPANVTRDAEACRDLITSLWYRTTFSVTWSVREDIDAKGKFQTTAGGLRISKGLTGSVVGIHVDCILIDDPDDAVDVYSEASRKARAAKLEALSSRLNDKRHYVMIVVQQRVHMDDCTGDLLSRGGWLHANYPVFYDASLRADSPFFVDPRSTPGANLHELRFTAEIIAAAKLELGSAGFDAQYQGNPGRDGAGTIKLGWLRWFTIAGWKTGSLHRPVGSNPAPAEELGVRRDGKLDLDYLDVSVDASFGSTSDTASDVSIQVIGGKGVKRYVFEDDTKVRTFLETVADIAAIITKWTPHHAGVIGVLVEKKANGAAVIETLALHFQGLIAIEPDGGKESRAAAMSPAVEGGALYVLEGAPWLDVYLTGSASVCAFPNGKKDDRMDALSQAMNHRRADLDAMRLAAKNAALLSLRARLARTSGLAPGNAG